MNNFNIIDIYRQVFSYRGIPNLFPVDTTNRVGIPEYDDMEVPDERTDTELMSMLGTPLFMPCKLGDIWLPNEPLITISGRNEIIKTKLTGIKGTVKEYIAMDDYSIKIQGLIINEASDDYPEDQVRQIRALCESKEAVKISNRLLTLFDIHQVTILDWDFIAVEGHQNCQAYQIACLSDWPVDLILVK